MAEISKITLPSGTTYDIKDATARQMASEGVSFIECTNASNTPQGVTWDDNGTTITGTLVASASTKGAFYLVPTVTQGGKDVFAEYFTVIKDEAYSWEKAGTTDIDLSFLGDLAYKDNASGTFTPSGTVSQPSFTGAEGNISVSGTPSGSVSAPTITVTPTNATSYVASSATGGGSVQAGTPASATMPLLETSVQNETLTLSWTSGSFTPNTPTAVTLPTFASQSIVTGIESAQATAPTFTGDAMSSSGKFTPSGTVSQPTFSGSQGNVIVN